VSEDVLAAGGIPVREGAEGPEVVVVHRTRYDDWTFPKGKLEAGESDEDCALREVAEETGLRCALEHELPATRYVDGRGRAKRVRWWRMRVISGELRPRPEEIDEARWVSPDEARTAVSYARDRELLRHL
jgi:8-oxo-dGTP diphosphatase